MGLLIFPPFCNTLLQKLKIRYKVQNSEVLKKILENFCCFLLYFFALAVHLQKIGQIISLF